MAPDADNVRMTPRLIALAAERLGVRAANVGEALGAFHRAADAGHDGWRAGFGDSEVVSAVAQEFRHPSGPEARDAALGFLVKTYRDHFDDEGPRASALKDAVASSLYDVHGSSVQRELLRHPVDPTLADALFLRGQLSLGHPMALAGKDAPLLESLGIDGSGSRVLVVDRLEDHAAVVRTLARPERSGAELLYAPVTSSVGRAFLQGVEGALARAEEEAADAVVISMGIHFGEEHAAEYLARAGGDERLARQLYEEDLAQTTARMEAFPGLPVVAAGNDGWHGWKNDLARSPRVLVGGAMVASERHTYPTSASAHHLNSLLGVGTRVFARNEHGEVFPTEQFTSWAAPQLGHFATQIAQAGRAFGQRLNGAELHQALTRTAEPMPGSIPRADVVTAVRYGRLLAYLKSLGDASLVEKLSTTRSPLPSILEAAWPLLERVEPWTEWRIRQLL